MFYLFRFLLLFPLVALLSITSAQQVTDANASWIPVNQVYDIYEYDGSIRRVNVNAFYIGEQPESNRNYHCYLEAIKKEDNDSLYRVALPRIEYLRASTSRHHAEFFATEYLFDERFAHYPALGLNLQQIQSYFKWKGQQLEEAYQKYRTEAGLTDEKKVSRSYMIFGQATILSALKSGYKRNYSPRQDTSLAAFHEWLKVHPEYLHLTPSPRSALQVRHPSLRKYGIQTVSLYGLEYTRERLGKDRKVTELFASIGRVKMVMNTPFEITTLVGLTIDRKRRRKLDYERTALIPFRYRMIDANSSYTGKEKGKPSTF